MKQYLDLLEDILDNGIKKQDRTGVGTLSVIGRQIRFNLQEGFPAVTTKSLAWKSVVSELLWFMEGSTNEHRLAQIKNDNRPYDKLTEKERHTIWTANFENQGKALCYSDGELGPIYGRQWRNYTGVNRFGLTSHCDQLEKVINEIQNNPWSRRLIVSAWNPTQIHEMALPPCHLMFQFVVEPGYGEHKDKPTYLNLMWTQRSCDVFLGLPFNIASYALLLSIVARITHLEPKTLVGSLCDTHIYLNHLDAVKTQLKRKPYPLPKLTLPAADYYSLFSFIMTSRCSDFKLEHYFHDAAIPAPMAI